MVVACVASGCSLDLSGRATFDASADDASEVEIGIDARPMDARTRDAGDAAADARTRDAERDTGGDRDAALDAGCRSGERACEGDVLLGCAAGVLVEIDRCVAGCHEREPRCLAVAPSNVGDPTLLDESDADVVLTAAASPWTIDTETGAIIGSGIEARRAADEGEGIGASGIGFHALEQSAGALSIAVFTMGSLRVDDGALVVARGSRPLVVLASRDVTIDGVIDVGAGLDGDRGTPGPGGAAGGVARTSAGGPGSGERGYEDFALQSGGGGGGHGGRGGDGGEATDLLRTVRGGTGGDAYDGTSPLRGGGGGGGGASSDRGGAGGGGGGAVQITAGGAIRVGPNGVVRAPGEGGRGAQSIGGAGGGGGAGGVVVLESMSVALDGRLSANGGGGGAGREGLGTHDGARGGDEPLRAPGGEGPGALTGDGGEGGAGDVTAGSQPGRANNPGGGGGGAGRVVIRAVDPSPVLLSRVSPTDSAASSIEPVRVR